MGNKDNEEAHLTRYLLGEISESERKQIEEAYFTDDYAFEQVLIAEEQLIDSYAQGEMDSKDERLSEMLLSSPQGQQRLRFARALASAASQSPLSVPGAAPGRPGGFFAALKAQVTPSRFAFAAVIVIGILVSSSLLIERSKMNDELRRSEQSRTELTRRVKELEQATSAQETRNRQLAAQLEDTNAQQDQKNGNKIRPSMLSFTLTPGLVRGSGPTTLSMPNRVAAVGLRLVVEGHSYVRYQAVMQSADGREVWRWNSIKPNNITATGLMVALPSVPNRNLPPGDYVLLLSGERKDGGYEDVADYSFRIVRK